MSSPVPRKIILIAHNLRSTHNVGSLLRTADGLGVESVILSGYTPYPIVVPNTVRPNTVAVFSDERLPHIALKIDAQIAKTALGAERAVQWQHISELFPVIASLRADGWRVMALEQAAGSIPLPSYEPPENVAIVLGREVEGIEPDVLAACDGALEIPMFGQKESYNVVQAAAMALYHCRFH